MKKRVLAALLALVMLFGALPMSVFAEDLETGDEFSDTYEEPTAPTEPDDNDLKDTQQPQPDITDPTEFIGIKTVPVQCDNKADHYMQYAIDGLIEKKCAELVWSTGSKEATLKLYPEKIANRFSAFKGTHTAVSTSVVTVTLTYNGGWKIDGAIPVIYVTCAAPEIPEVPDKDADVIRQDGFELKCVNDKATHQKQWKGTNFVTTLRNGTYTVDSKATLKNGRYSFNVVAEVDTYLPDYNSESFTNTVHTRATGVPETVTLTFYYNETTGKWSVVETLEKEFTPADAEDGKLTRAAVSISVGTQPAGYYYRIRCIHELEYDNGWYEAKSTKTDGVLLTNIK